MPVNQLQIYHFRAIETVTIQCRSDLNIITGPNGSGKTSILEAIYYLSLLKSFRPAKQGSPIQHGQAQCWVYALLAGHDRIGLELLPNHAKRCHVNGQSYSSRAQLAQLLPVQLFNADTFQLFEGSPDWRRRFMNWGMFHVEHQFLAAWQRYQSLIKQRNALLKQTGIGINEIKVWDKQLVEVAEQLTELRYQFVTELEQQVQQLAQTINYSGHIQLALNPGWQDNLRAELDKNFESDRKFGFTQCGAHRADLMVYINQRPAVEQLSRGQQKLLVIMVKIAQACLYQKKINSKGILLLDDIGSELDDDNYQRAMELLAVSDNQIFITAISSDPIVTYYNQRDGAQQFNHYQLK